MKKTAPGLRLASLLVLSASLYFHSDALLVAAAAATAAGILCSFAFRAPAARR